MATQQQHPTTVPISTTANNHSVELAMSELNDTISRLASHKGVETVQILNREGDIIMESTTRTATTTTTTNDESTMPTTPTANGTAADSTVDSHNNNDTEVSYLCKQAALTKQMIDLATLYISNAASTGSTDSNSETNSNDDEISFLQIRSKNGHELMIAPNDGYVLAVHKRF